MGRSPRDEGQRSTPPMVGTPAEYVFGRYEPVPIRVVAWLRDQQVRILWPDGRPDVIDSTRVRLAQANA